MQEMMKPDIPDMSGQGNAANKINTAGSSKRMPIVIGKTAVGVNTVYSQSILENKTLLQVHTICEGEIKSIWDMYMNDHRYFASDDSPDIGMNINNESNDVEFSEMNTHYKNDQKILCQFRIGKNVQPASKMIMRDNPEWTNKHTGNGICYIATRMTREAESKITSTPNIAVIVEGALLREYDTPTYSYSRLPGRAVFHYLVNSHYGMSIPERYIDKESFKALDAFATQEGYFVDGVISADNTPKQNIQSILSSVRGASCCFVHGRVKLVYEQNSKPVMSYNDSNIIDNNINITVPNPDDLPSTIRAAYYNPEKRYELDYVSVSAPDMADNGKIDEMDFPFTKDVDKVIEIAYFNLLRRNFTRGIELEVNLTGMSLEPYDIIEITSESNDLKKALFRVIKTTLSYGKTTVKVQAVEHNPALYSKDWKAVKPSNKEYLFSTDGLGSIEEVTNLKVENWDNNDGVESTSVKLTWVNGKYAVSRVVYYKESSSSKWIANSTLDTMTDTAIVNNLALGTSYDFKITTANSANMKKDSLVVTNKTNAEANVPGIGDIDKIPGTPNITSLTPRFDYVSGDIQFEVRFDEVENAVGYTVFYKRDTDSYYQSIKTAGGFVSIKNLSQATYLVYVVAESPLQGNNKTSETVKQAIVTPTPSVPSSVQTVQRYDMVNDIAYADVTWGLPSEARTFTITTYTGIGNIDKRYSTRTNSTTLSVPVTTNATLSFTITESNVWGKSATTPMIKVLFNIPAPLAPTNLTLLDFMNADGTGALNVKFKTINGYTQVIEFKESSDSVWLPGPSATGNNQYITVPIWNLMFNTQYDVRVKSVNISGKSSPWISGTHLLVPPPAEKVVNVKADIWYGYHENTIRVEWDKVVNTLKYNVKYKIRGNQTWTTASTVNTYYDIPAPGFNNIYEYEISSVNILDNESPAYVDKITNDSGQLNFKQATNEEFTTDDLVSTGEFKTSSCNVTWLDVQSQDMPYTGKTHEIVNDNFAYFEVEVTNENGVVRRVEKVYDNLFNYTYEMNYTDGLTRKIGIQVYIVLNKGTRFAVTRVKRFFNNQISANELDSLKITGENSAVMVRLDKSKIPDIAGLEVHVGLEENFTLSESTLLGVIGAEFPSRMLQAITGRFFFAVRAYDMFDKNELDTKWLSGSSYIAPPVPAPIAKGYARFVSIDNTTSLNLSNNAPSVVGNSFNKKGLRVITASSDNTYAYVAMQMNEITALVARATRGSGAYSDFATLLLLPTVCHSGLVATYYTANDGRTEKLNHTNGTTIITNNQQVMEVSSACQSESTAYTLNDREIGSFSLANEYPKVQQLNTLNGLNPSSRQSLYRNNEIYICHRDNTNKVSKYSILSNTNQIMYSNNNLSETSTPGFIATESRGLLCDNRNINTFSFIQPANTSLMSISGMGINTAMPTAGYAD